MNLRPLTNFNRYSQYVYFISNMLWMQLTYTPCQFNVWKYKPSSVISYQDLYTVSFANKRTNLSLFVSPVIELVLATKNCSLCSVWLGTVWWNNYFSNINNIHSIYLIWQLYKKKLKSRDVFWIWKLDLNELKTNIFKRNLIRINYELIQMNLLCGTPEWKIRDKSTD